MRDQEKILMNMKNLFNTLYKGKKSESFRRIFKEVYGSDYLEEFDYDSFITMTELHNFVKHLNISPTETFIDIGCGRGGPGLWIARETEAQYVGIDISEIAVEVAKNRAEIFGLKNKTKFQVKNICETNFSDNFFDGAISIDTLGFVTDIQAAIQEVARILRKGASFVFTCWEENNSNLMRDFRPLLRAVGFLIEKYIESEDWESRQREVYQKILESKKILIKDMGREAAFIPIMEAKQFLPLLKEMRRIFVVVKKP